jgi:putative transposase
MTLRRALEDWKNQNYDKWVFAREGEKALEDKVLPFIERDSSKLAVGECLVADGHVLNFQIINPITGRPGRAALIMWFDWASRYPAGWNIMFTESTQNIHAALRRAILALGKLPGHVLLDNGKAFKAQVFTSPVDFETSGIRGLYARLGIETHFARAYNAKAKPVERFFGTFNDLERLLPSYTGRSIEDKPAWMHRNEKLHKKLHNTWIPTIDEANTAIHRWVDEEYAVRPHEGLNGRTPIEAWSAGKGPGVDSEMLRILMLTTDKKMVHRNGIQFMGVNFYDEALYGYRKPVVIRYDMENLDEIYVYNEDGTEFICAARPVQSVHPLASSSGNTLDMETLKAALALKKRLKKDTELSYRTAAADLDQNLQLLGFHPDAATLDINQMPARPMITRGEAEHIEAQARNITVIPLKKEKKLFMNQGEAMSTITGQ